MAPLAKKVPDPRFSESLLRSLGKSVDLSRPSQKQIFTLRRHQPKIIINNVYFAQALTTRSTYERLASAVCAKQVQKLS